MHHCDCEEIMQKSCGEGSKVVTIVTIVAVYAFFM